MSNNIAEDTPRHLLVGIAYDSLMKGPHPNPGKLEERKKLLSQNSELRIRPDTVKLRSIINYLDFKCHPGCSIGRDEAIKGSDIDGGIVITQDPVSQKEQLDFISELRRQGFDVYHQSDYEETKLQVKQTPHNSMLIIELERRKNNKVSFYTKEYLERLARNSDAESMSELVMLYLAGKSI